MPAQQSLRAALTDGEWRYPLLAGLVSGTYVALQYWESPSPSEPVDATAVFLAGLLGGALFHGTGVSTRVGLRTGLVAAVPAIPVFYDTVRFVLGLTQPAWFAAVQIVFVAGALVVLAGLSGVVGALGAVLGDWLAAKTGPERPHSADG